MAGRRKIIPVAAVLLCALLGVPADTPVTGPGTAAATAAPPAAGVLRPLWRLSLRRWAPSMLLAGKVVVTIDEGSPQGHGPALLEGRDLTGGRPLWRAGLGDLDPFHSPVLAASGGLVALGYADLEDEDGTQVRDRLRVIDPRTGTVRWNRAALRPREGTAERELTLLGAGSGRVLAAATAGGPAAVAFAARDGATVWRSAAPTGCAIVSGGADRLAAVLLRCGRTLWLRALDLATGRLVWERRIPATDNPDVHVQEDFVSVVDSLGGVLFDAAGDVLADLPGDRSRPVIGSHTIAIPNVGENAGRTELQLIDRATGARRSWSWSAGEWPSVFAADGELYVESEIPGLLQVRVLQRIARGGGAVPVALLPPAWGRSVLAMGSGVLLADASPVNANGTDLTAYRIEPLPEPPPGLVARGGVPAARWPDACALLPADRLGELLPDESYTASPRPAPAVLGLGRPIGCDLEPAGGRTPPVAVSVLWVSPSAEEARERMAFLRHGRPDRAMALPGVGDEAFARQTTPDLLVLRAGSILVRLDVPGDPALARQLAGEVADRLREPA